MSRASFSEIPARRRFTLSGYGEGSCRMAAQSFDIVEPARKLGDHRRMLLPGFFRARDLLVDVLERRRRMPLPELLPTCDLLPELLELPEQVHHTLVPGFFPIDDFLLGLPEHHRRLLLTGLFPSCDPLADLREHLRYRHLFGFFPTDDRFAGVPGHHRRMRLPGFFLGCNPLADLPEHIRRLRMIRTLVENGLQDLLRHPEMALPGIELRKRDRLEIIRDPRGLFLFRYRPVIRRLLLRHVLDPLGNLPRHPRVGIQAHG